MAKYYANFNVNNGTSLIRDAVFSNKREACKVESLTSERIDLYSGQSVSDTIVTHGFGARKEAFKALTGMSCPIRRSVGKDVEMEWNDAVEDMYDFAI
jgi:hypothetical protein